MIKTHFSPVYWYWEMLSSPTVLYQSCHQPWQRMEDTIPHALFTRWDLKAPCNSPDLRGSQAVIWSLKPCCCHCVSVCVCLYICVCVCVPGLRCRVELLCASFCYVMKNHIRIHFSAGQARGAWHACVFCCGHPPAPPVLSFSSLSSSPSVLCPPIQPLPPTTARTVTSKTCSACVFIKLFTRGMGVCVSLHWHCVCCYRW